MLNVSIPGPLLPLTCVNDGSVRDHYCNLVIFRLQVAFGYLLGIIHADDGATAVIGSGKALAMPVSRLSFNRLFDEDRCAGEACLLNSGCSSQ